MVPIKKKLSDQEAAEYVELILKLRTQWESCENAIKKFCDSIKAEYELPEIDVDIPDTSMNYPILSKWLLLPFNELRQIRDIIDTDNYHDDYLALVKEVGKFKNIYKSFSKAGINRWIIETSGVKICPYCNLAYTFNRRNKTMAQLDHFYPKSDYPEFAICYYNLIPCCPSCNRIKSKYSGTLVSPYEDNAFSTMRILATTSRRINYLNIKETEANIKVEIMSDREEDLNNIEKMGIGDAYIKLNGYAAEILRKKAIYKNKNSRKLIIDAIKRAGISDDEILRFYFGNYIDEEKGKGIMDKMASDLFHQDEI